jgi:hypothetical protein
MTPDTLQRLAAEHRRERLLAAQHERLAAQARTRRPPRRHDPRRLAASIGQLLAVRREAVTR